MINKFQIYNFYCKQDTLKGTSTSFRPSAIFEFNSKSAMSRSWYTSCNLCPRECKADRTAGETGYCGAGDSPVVSSVFPHRGEESVLSGTNGSGTIFFSGCNLKCIFCQNADISFNPDNGKTVSTGQLASYMLSFQKQGCHNINFVTPTHVVPSIIDAVSSARSDGLSIPTVYNCGGYESVEIIKKLEDTIDIYMPDFKFFASDKSSTYCSAPDYPDAVRNALIEMNRQKGVLQIRNGSAVSGILIRHLVMPDGYDDSRAIIDWISENLSPGTAINIMGQYRPCHKAVNFNAIRDYPDKSEIDALKQYASKSGLNLVD